MKHHAVQSGSGPCLVLVHGLGGNLHSWDEIVEVLGERFSILRYDLRGHGLGHNPKGPWTLDEMVCDLRQVIESAGWARFALVGFSLGGLIAQGFTLKHPKFVRKLGILSAVAGRSEAERRKVVERLKNLERGDLQTNIDLAMERWFTPEFRRSCPEKVAERIRTLESNDPEGYRNAYRVFSLGDLGESLHRITCPTLVLTGEDDPGSNARMARYMHERIAGSRLEILPGLRHSLLVEAPQTVAGILEEFLS